MKINRILAAVLTAVILLGVMPFPAQAASWGQGDTLDDALSELKVGFDNTRLDWLALPGIGTVDLRYSYFKYKNERTGTVDEHPVYCIDPTKGGAYDIVRNVGPNPDDGSNTATYIRGEKVGDERYRAIMSSGFPHHKYTSLGLQSREEAYYATKTALWMYIRGNDATKLTINPKYGNNDAAAVRVRDAAAVIYTKGTTASTNGTYAPFLKLTGKPSAAAKPDANGEYYVQGIEVFASGWVGTDESESGDVKLSWDSPPPAGTVVLGSNGEDITSSMLVTTVIGRTGAIGTATIKYPASAVPDPETFRLPTLKASAVVPNNGMYIAYAKVNKETYQRYLVESDPKTEAAASFTSQIRVEAPDKEHPSDTGLRVRKVETGTNKPLEGAVFEILDPEGKLIYSMATDTEGLIDIPLYKAGNYTVTETVPPQYHLPAGKTTQSVTVRCGEIAEVTFANLPYGTLRVVKRDAADGTPLGGASILIRSITSDTMQEKISDSSGSAVFEKLPVGAYEITEKAAPNGYTLSGEARTVNVVPLSEGETSYVLTNKATPKLRILKIDAISGKPLANAEFRVTKVEGKTVSEYITGENGEILIEEGLDEAVYLAEEFMSPDGYIRYDESKEIMLECGKTKTLKFDNIRKPVAVFLKTDALTGKGIPGATFKVEYELPDGGLKDLGSYKTGEDGRIIIPKAESGRYVFTETLPASGFSLPNNPVTRIYFAPGDNAYLAEFEHYYTGGALANGGISADKAQSASPSVSAAQIAEHSGNEYYKEGEGFNWPLNSIVIKKPHAITGELLSGAAFELYRADEQVSGVPGTAVGRYTTDNSGVVVITGLEPGYYVVKEVKAPQNFLISETGLQNGFLKADGTTVLEFTFADYPYGSLLISKTDGMTGEPLAGARFKVTDAAGAAVGNTNGEYISDSRGEILIPNVKPGAVVVTEIEAPPDYAITTTPQTVRIGTDGKTYKVTFENYPSGGIVIRKTDSVTREPLAGVEFKVTDSAGSVVGNSNGIFTTDAQGVITIPNLPKGSYVITETKALPTHILEAETKTVAVDYGKTYTLDFYNRHKSGLQIIKIDAESKKPLKGAVFTVYKMNGEIVGTYETNGDGVIILDNLDPSWYKIAETKSPDEYLLEDTPKDVEITSDQFVKIVFENKPLAGLLIVKTDEKTGKPLEGVVFDVTMADGRRVSGNTPDGNQPGTEADSPNRTTSPNGDISGSYTTDRNGRILINGLPAGEYHVTERKALDDYELDTDVHSVTVTPGKPAALQLTNRQRAGLRLIKIDSITKKGIYNVEFMVFDNSNKVVGTYYTDNSGIIDFTGELPEGRYTIRETRPAPNYYADDVPRTVEFKAGRVTEVRWENTPQMAQIQILKKSGDDNEINGLPAGTPLAGAVFEAYEYKSGNIADRFISGADGRAVSKPLPLGRYVVKEVQSPQYYRLSTQVLDIEPEFATQIVKQEFLNYSANTGVYIKKTGPAECMPGDTIRYDIRAVQNTSTVPLTDFYWRDTLPTDAVRLSKIVTGTFNQSLKYKVMITTSKGDSRVIADNLVTTMNNVIDCSGASLGLYSDEYVTSVTFVFGTVKAGFAQVEQPQIYVKTLTGLSNGYQFANKADIGGKYGREWVVGNSTCLTTIYKKPVPLPRTGY